MWVAWVGLGVIAFRSGRNPTQGAPIPYARRNYAGPQHFCLYRGVLRVGAGNRAGPPSSGGSAFSSGATLASLGVRKSFVLRDERDIKTQFATDFGRCAIPESGAWGWGVCDPAAMVDGRLAPSACNRRVCTRGGGECECGPSEVASRHPLTETRHSWEL